MASISLYFASARQPELYMTRFADPGLGAECWCARGCTAGAAPAGGTFLWTSAVKALSILFLRTAAAGGSSRPLAGTRRSAAASLDYALTKEPQWLVDMFGSDAAGRAAARRIFLRSNTELKRPGPVLVAVNTGKLPFEQIEVLLDGLRVKDAAALAEMARQIEVSGFAGEQQTPYLPQVPEPLSAEPVCPDAPALKRAA